MRMALAIVQTVRRAIRRFGTMSFWKHLQQALAFLLPIIMFK